MLAGLGGEEEVLDRLPVADRIAPDEAHAAAVGLAEVEREGVVRGEAGAR